MSNNINISNLDHAPAQKVGGMRVKEPHAHRIPLKEEEAKDASTMKEEEEAEGREVLHDEEQDNMDEEEKMRIRAQRDRQAQDMQNHVASRQPDVSKNAGTNVKQQYIPNAQPRSMNH
jgi:hypothetical protein